MNRISLSFALCTALIAVNVSAQVSTEYRNWGNSAVRYLMMKQETADWALIRTDENAKAFIDLFWARRDPTPDTPVNELRQELETRISDADKRFSAPKTPGSQTDRGLAYVLFGEPSEIVNRTSRPRASSGSVTRFERPTNIQTWIYRNQAADRVTGAKGLDIALAFDDERSPAEFVLEGPSRQSFDSSALAIAKRVLKRPFLTAADLSSADDAMRMVALRLIVVADSATAHDVVRRAQEGENFADLARKYSLHASAPGGGYVGRVPFADLTDDVKVALAAKEAGKAVLVVRGQQFAIFRLLSEAEAAAADAAVAGTK